MLPHYNKLYFLLASVFFVLSVLLLPSTAISKNLEKGLSIQQKTQRDGAKSQKKINKIDDETKSLVHEYRYSLNTLEDLDEYNRQLERQIADQEKELSRKQNELSEIEITHRRIVPLMLRMLEVFESFVKLDVPFLPGERKKRVEQLVSLMDRSDVTLAEKYRRIMEAYQVEAKYGHHIESYQGEANVEGTVRTVDFMRLGRVGLYYLSLDGKSAGLWNTQKGVWESLENGYLEPIRQAILIAKNQLPPDLIKLPLSTPEMGERQ